MSTDLAATRNAIARISTGKQVNEDAYMTMWCNTNWGDLLQPAPLSIALLGSIIILSASTDDFSLLNPDDPVPYQWKYATHPGSFKACLMQMVGEGYHAFGSAHKNMTRIQNASGQVPDVIKTAVATIITGSPQEVEAFLPDQIQSALDLAQICASSAKECEEAFCGISNLASELVVACTNQVGTSEQKLNANKVKLDILEESQKSEQERVAASKEACELMKKSFVNAEQDFHNAVESMPSGWSLVGMQFVESLTQVVGAASNLISGVSNIAAQSTMAGISLIRHGPEQDNNGDLAQSAQATRAAGAAITDPGVLAVFLVLPHVISLKLLLTGGPEGGPDWDTIRGSGEDTRSGGVYVQESLKRIKDQLSADTKNAKKPIAAKLLPMIETSVSDIQSILQIARSAQAASPGILDKFKPRIDQTIKSLQELETKANLILQQTGTSALGPATPPTPSKSKTSNSAAKMVVENAKFKIDQTRANLEASRTIYNDASERLIKQQEEMSKTIASLTSLKLTNAGLQAMLPVLREAVCNFTQLQAQFSQLTQFFQSVASLLGDVLQPSVNRWAKTMKSSLSLGGVSISALARQLIYTQMMLPLRVSMLSEKIATTYLTVSDGYILPAQRTVGNMMQFSDDTSEQGRAALKAKLEKEQLALKQKAEDGSKEIRELVAADQKKFSASIDKRLNDIHDTLQRVLPEISQPVPHHITQITTEHVEKLAEKREKIAEEVHGSSIDFNLDDMM